ncbi:unnamed protein product [Hyaloperonospora brassicae]|uniref:Uncharacterized protein n=1 Tax=Hyaloperonospora brassicae TaxID=162125 RepID=A0AAV0V246_HYABA|nr:unnamed protein product [Hyaloperonospora brassicae]
MASHSTRCPTLAPRVTDLYGACGSVYRVGEAEAYAQALDDLEREERALENMVQELVHRRAPVPIGVKFHRERVGVTLQQEVAARVKGVQESEVSSRGREVSSVGSSSSDEEEDGEDEDGEDVDNDDDELMDDEDERGEGDTSTRATIVRGEGPQRGGYLFARDSFEAGDDSMEMEEPLRPSDWP